MDKICFRLNMTNHFEKQYFDPVGTTRENSIKLEIVVMTHTVSTLHTCEKVKCASSIRFVIFQ